MNALTVADIKRGGFAVLEVALKNGPVHLLKRNKTSAVLLSVEDYEALVKRSNQTPAPKSGLALFLKAGAVAKGGLDRDAMQARISSISSDWESTVGR